MLVYNYDKITKEFLNTSHANIDILESEKQGKEVYILPAHATFKAPPQKQEGYTSCFSSQKDNWEKVEDHRGQIVYNKDDLSEYVIEEIGPVPPAYFVTKPVAPNKYMEWRDRQYVYPEITKLKQQVKQDLDLAYEQKLQELHKVGKYYVQAAWATIYTNTLVAIQQDEAADGKLDNVYNILLITHAKLGTMTQIQIKAIKDFMPYYNKVKQVYKELTESYHQAIAKISTEMQASAIVDIILNY